MMIYMFNNLPSWRHTDAQRHEPFSEGRLCDRRSLLKETSSSIRPLALMPSAEPLRCVYSWRPDPSHSKASSKHAVTHSPKAVSARVRAAGGRLSLEYRRDRHIPDASNGITQGGRGGGGAREYVSCSCLQASES